jgi:hypothetical protein
MTRTRRRRQIARLVDRLIESSEWEQARMLLARHPKPASQAAEDRLAGLAELSAQVEDREAAAVYRIHQPVYPP